MKFYHYPYDHGVLRDIEQALGQETKLAICLKRVPYKDTALNGITCPGCRAAMEHDLRELEVVRSWWTLDPAIIDRLKAVLEGALGPAPVIKLLPKEDQDV